MIMINIFDQSLTTILSFRTKKMKEMFSLVLKRYSEKSTIKNCVTDVNMHYVYYLNKNQTILQISSS